MQRLRLTDPQNYRLSLVDGDLIMCFVIDKTAKRPMQKYVWKVLTLNDDGSLESPIYAYSKGGRAWQPNAVIECQKRGPFSEVAGRFMSTTSLDILYSRVAARGIYVYLQKPLGYGNKGNNTILRLRVDPKDWLFSSKYCEQATYRKVFVPEEQPYIEWYD